MHHASLKRKLSAGVFVLGASLACTCGLLPFSQPPAVDELPVNDFQAPLQERVLLDTQDGLSDGYDSGLQFGDNLLVPWADITAFQVLELSDGSLQFVIAFNVAGDWQAELSAAQEMYRFPPDSRPEFFSIGFYDPDRERFMDDFFDVDNLGQHTLSWALDPGMNEFQGQYAYLQGNAWAKGDGSFFTVKAEGSRLLITAQRQNWMAGAYVYATMAACVQDCLLDFSGYEPSADSYAWLVPPGSSSEQAAITLENNLDVSVCFVRIRSSNGGVLDEQLVADGEALAPGERLTTQVAVGEVIDIQIRDCSDLLIDEQFSIEVTADGLYYPFSPSTGLGED